MERKEDIMLVHLIIFVAGFALGGWVVGKFVSNRIGRELERAKKTFGL